MRIFAYMKKTSLPFLLAAVLFLAACGPKTPVKVACVGDSITAGATIEHPETDGYPARLQALLGEGFEVRNFGFSGRTLLNKGDRPYMKEPMYRDALDFEPGIVTIKLGTNDTKPWNWQYSAEFKQDLLTMVRAFQALPSSPKIYLCYPVAAFREDWGINDSLIRTDVQKYISEVAAETGCKVIDLYTPFRDRPDLYNDAIHPNVEGAALIAATIAPELCKYRRRK